MLETNQPAPAFTTVNQDGDEISLAQYRSEKHIVLYFYPKDDTPRMHHRGERIYRVDRTVRRRRYPGTRRQQG